MRYSHNWGERSPKLNSEREEFRVCSMPNGQWQAQEFKPLPEYTLDDSGRKIPVDRRTSDPWSPLARPTDLSTALQQRDAYAARRAA